MNDLNISMKENEIISVIEEIIKEQTGIILEKGRKVDLDIVLRSRLIFHKMLPEKYVEFLKYNHDEIVLVASCFTIQETSFYRYKSHFDRLKLEIIPELLIKNKDTNKTLQILSAGCATGEEPYTISMILNDLIPNIKDWNIKITATDINENALNIAKEGIYSEYKLRNIDTWYINRYFTKIESGKSILYKLKDTVKNLVSFRHCNLIREPFELADLSNIDIIFCENVIIYFCMDSIQRLINNFYNILKKDGYLFLGYSETLNFIKHKFILSWWNDSFTYKKSEKEEEPVYYDFKKLAQAEESKGTKDEEDYTAITNKSYEDIINLILRNYNQELFDNVSVLLRKIEESKIQIDEIFYIIKAEFIFDKSDYINATNECRKAINKNPHSIDAHIILGIIYLKLNLLDSAAFEFKTALYIDKNSVLANYYYALYNRLIKNNAECENYLNYARKQLNENGGILKNRIYPVNEKTYKKIYNDLLNLQECFCTN